MTNYEKMQDLIKASDDGIVTTKQLTEEGIHRSILRDAVEAGELYRFSRGVYVVEDAWEDEFSLLQRKYSRGIFSHETALYLLGYSDRTPARYTMTFPQGYNTASLKEENVLVKQAVPKKYSLGVITINSPCNNPIRVYDLEKTLCDILCGNAGDIQQINAAMKKYAASKDKDIHKLIQYARQLRVESKVMRYMEVLL